MSTCTIVILGNIGNKQGGEYMPCGQASEPVAERQRNGHRCQKHRLARDELLELADPGHPDASTYQRLHEERQAQLTAQGGDQLCQFGKNPVYQRHPCDSHGNRIWYDLPLEDA